MLFVQVRGYFEGVKSPCDHGFVPNPCPMILRHSISCTVRHSPLSLASVLVSASRN
jgi:hypothetical protein